MFFKAEHLQKTGAFKYRGAAYAISRLPAGTTAVATHSSGNHGAALSAAARDRGMAAHIVVPRGANAAKLAAIKAFGGIVHVCAPNQQAREEGLAELITEGWSPIPPYDDDNIISGQGTAALELLHEQLDLDTLITPVGGGGLLSGTLLATLTRPTPLAVFGAEPAGADDTFRSLQAGRRLTDGHEPQTVADGLRALVGRRNFALIQTHADGVITVSDDEINAAMKLIWRHLKQVVEPSAATVLAAVLKEPNRFAGRRIGLILSGGNIDMDALLL